MVDFHSLLNLQFQMFIYVFLGFILSKVKIINNAGKLVLTDLVIYIVLPSSIITSFLIEVDMNTLVNLSIVLIISFIIQFACLGLSYILYRKQEASSYSVLKYATICSNSGFMGTPLVQSIYGLEGLLYSSIYLIAVRVFMWSVGLACFCDTNFKAVIRKVLTHPCIIAVFIGFIIMISQINLPDFLVTSLDGIGSSTTFLSMLVIGVILSDADISKMLSKLSMFYSFIRLIFIPVCVFIPCYLLGLDPLVACISSVLAGMPAGGTTALLASKYNGNEQLASQLVLISTSLSLFTIPLLCMLIEMMY